MREQELLQNVLNEIERLQNETLRLRAEATQQLDNNWHTASEALRAFFEKWQESIGSERFATYAIKDGQLTLLPSLSKNQETMSSLSSHSLSHTPTSTKNENLLRQVRLALGSFDMQADFSQKRIFVPIAFADSPCGLIIAELFELEKSKYMLIVKETAAFLDALRGSLRVPNSTQIFQTRAS